MTLSEKRVSFISSATSLPYSLLIYYNNILSPILRKLNQEYLRMSFTIIEQNYNF